MSQPIQCFLQTLPFQRPFNDINGHYTRHYSLPLKPRFKYVSANLNTTTTPTILNINGEESSKTPPIQIQIQMPSKTSSPSYSSLIQDCINSKSFDLGKSIHAQMLSNGYTPDTFLQTKILMLYARAGNLSDLDYARKLFDKMTDRNSTSWNTMILAYSRVDDHMKVLELFFQMQRSGILPNKFTFPSVVKACVALEECNGVRQVQGSIFKTGLNHHLVVGGALVDGYAKFGSMDDALIAFDEIDGKNVVTWNSVIAGYVREMRWEEAWGIFYGMQRLDVDPDHFTLATAIRICGALRSLDRGKQVHAKLFACGFRGDTFVANSLVDMYAKCGDGESCLQVFDQMAGRDRVSWNSMISAEVQFGHFYEALVLFSRMQESGFKSDRFNLGSILVACAGLADVEMGRELHGHLIRNFLDSDTILGSALVDMYSKCGLIEEAHQAFERLMERNEVSWNVLITGYVQEGKVEEALELYHNMQLAENIQPDQFTFTTLLSLCADQMNENQGKQIHAHIIRTVSRKHIVIVSELVHMYSECGRLNYARKIFNRMEERNAYSWNSLIEGYEQNNQPEEALELFRQMQLTGIKPDCFSLASMLSSSISLSNLPKGKQIHGFIVRNALEEQGILQYVLVDMYAKCGVIGYACKVYEQTRKKDVVLQNVMVSAFASCGKMNDAKCLFNQMDMRNRVSWNSILVGYAKSGLMYETFNLFQRMQEDNVEFDSLTLVTVTNLCASLPDLGKGEQLHALAVKKGFVHSSVVLDSALVDMYAKVGSIEEARRVFDKMHNRNVISWNAMITGYSKHGHSEEVLVLYEQMQKEGIHPNEVTFLSVLSACSHTGLMEEGLSIFISMIEEHGIEAKAEHYTCMVDLLGRAGRLEDAKEVIDRMPVEPEVSTWGALLGACRVHRNVELGRVAADRLFGLDPQNPGHYVLMSNIYAAANRWKEADEIRQMMKIHGVKKDPGVSWIEINNEIQNFHAGSKTHPRTEEIYTTLRNLSLRMKGLGYIPDTNFILRNVEGIEEEYLLQHSERLAIALGLISLPEKSTIRVFKNLRICGDCHTATKFISRISGRRIIVRDTNRFHHFENGECSCGDYW
ncbi:hypothetical protein HHK36_014806 [Tetracentron sinense]|uniref:DYW domain-containing protein n=1 Tax=Tetracentron sinense TaxID=13715 RepID=A0A835DD90_TETSI|nr:hypothetical protein HHK36_014806 [Tetracentron sinense]